MKISKLRQIIKEEIANALGSKPSFQDLDDIAKELKAAVDSGEIKVHTLISEPVQGATPSSIQGDGFKYGAYAVEEAWGPVSRALGLNIDDYDAMDYVIDTLRNKKLIHLEW